MKKILTILLLVISSFAYSQTEETFNVKVLQVIESSSYSSIALCYNTQNYNNLLFMSIGDSVNFKAPLLYDDKNFTFNGVFIGTFKYKAKNGNTYIIPVYIEKQSYKFLKSNPWLTFSDVIKNLIELEILYDVARDISY